MFSSKQISAVLEYFRNISHQALFFGCAVFFWAHRDTRQVSFEWSDIKATAVAVSCTALWLASFMMSFVHFFDQFVRGSDRLEKVVGGIRRGHRTDVDRLCLVLRFAWRHNKIAFVESIIVFVLTYSTLMPVAMVAVQTANGLIKSGL